MILQKQILAHLKKAEGEKEKERETEIERARVQPGAAFFYTLLWKTLLFLRISARGLSMDLA